MLLIMKRRLFTELLQHAARAGVIVAAASFVALAQSAGNAPPAGEFVPFDRFIADTANGTSSRTVVDAADAASSGAVPGKVKNAAALTEMRQHVLDLYKGTHVSHSFVQGALTFDCIPMEEQPSVRMLGLKEIAAPPPLDDEPVSAPSDGAAAVRLGSGVANHSPLLSAMGADGFGNVMACEEHTVPVQRTTVEQMSRFPTLRAFLSKSPDGAGVASVTATPGARPVNPRSVRPLFGHEHLYTFQNVYNLGANSSLDLWNPQINRQWGQIFSLSQVWVMGKSKSTEIFPDQTVEAGWQVYPSRTGDQNTHLFTYYTADGYNSTGCYDTTCGNFIQTSSVIYPGRTYTIPIGLVSHVTVVTFKWWQGNWWLGVDGYWVGYYPGRLFGSGELATHSTRVQFGGEVAAGDGTSYYYYPVMGSGLNASYGYLYAAYQNHIWYHDTLYNKINPSLTTINECPSGTSIVGPSESYPFASGDLHFFFGGPMGWCQ